MNLISTTFRFLAISIIMCASIINGQDKQSSLYDHKFTIASAAFASKLNKEELAQKAAIKVVGYAFDTMERGNTINPCNIGLVFFINYVAEKICKDARYYGFSIDALAEKCDILPDGPMRNIVNPITRVAVDTITDFQTLIILGSIKFPYSS